MLTTRQLKAKNAAKALFRNAPRAYSTKAWTPGQSNVLGYGIGSRFTGSQPQSVQDTLVVYVRDSAAARRAIPPQLAGIPTEIVEIGDIVAFCPVTSQQRDKRLRPAPGGVSVGHPAISAGTLGCLAEKEGRRYLLSNNHILANLNRASLGDKIIQPAAADGGTSPQDDIATLTAFEPIRFDDEHPNRIDAAIASLDRPEDVTPELLEIGRLHDTVCEALVGQPVCKHGRTTGYTTGIVTAVSADILVDYDVPGQRLQAWFEDQIVIQDPQAGSFSRPGDSGSLIVSCDTHQPVALLFAGDDYNRSTFANPIGAVLERFGIRIVTRAPAG